MKKHIARIKQQRTNKAFTVAELMIVIVVIGILAALTVVGYNSWQDQAAETEVGASLQAVQTGMDNFRNMTDNFPVYPAGTEFDGSNDTKDIFVQSKTVKVVYVKGNKNGFCVDVQSLSRPEIVKFLDTTGENTVIQEGNCTPAGPEDEEDPEEEEEGEGGGGSSVPCTGFNVGDEGPGGGTIFYIDSTTCYEVAPAGWYGTSDDPSAEWGCYDVTVEGADGTAIGTGKQNTAAILAADCQLRFPSAGYPLAVDIATEYNGGGLNDWYLPNRAEYQEVYNHFGSDSFLTCCAYWTSEERSGRPREAWTFRFSVGSPSNGGKDNRNRVRPIRSFGN